MGPTKCLLLVDDNRNDLELTLRVLESQKLCQKIAVANDGVEALDYLFCRGVFSSRSPEPPAAIFLDLKMPRVDGFEVLEKIKADPILKTIPIIMFTSSNLSEDVSKCYGLGANAFVVKSVDYKEFVSKVKELGRFWTEVNETPSGTNKEKDAECVEKAPTDG